MNVVGKCMDKIYKFYKMLTYHHGIYHIKITYKFIGIVLMGILALKISFNLLFSKPKVIISRNKNYVKFPDNFIWAVGTSSYQIEGAWNEAGKGVSIWDTLTHKVPSKIKDHQNGDVTCDSYHRFKNDIQLMRQLGVKYYRMSLSWTRILPQGTVTEGVNQDGIQYYQTLFETLKQNGIEPMVTLDHWDYPQSLQEFNGWLNPRSVIWFSEYAQLCFKSFGKWVKYWYTINEPSITASIGYGYGVFAPSITSCRDTCPLIAAHHMILAHAHAYAIYKQQFAHLYNGQVSIVLHSKFYEAGSDSALDIESADNALQFELGWFAHPVIYGDYPEVMKSNVKEESNKKGLNESMLPQFTDEQKRLIKGSIDFFSLNYYTSRYSFYDATHMSKSRIEIDKEWHGSGSEWLKVTPWGLKKLLLYISKTYNNIPVMITENGVSDNSGALDDLYRISYIRDHIYNIGLAMAEGCNVLGYTVWSLMDNFEWISGFTEKFGLHHVNFSDPLRTRTQKSSAKFYAAVIRDNSVSYYNNKLP